MARVLVTGANGFVGGALCARLQADEVEVTGAVRRAETLAALPAGTAGVVVGDLDAEADWSQALRGVEVVVHLAARVHIMRDSTTDPLSAYRRVNVEGTRRLLEAAAAAGARRFVLLSSVKATGEGGPPGTKPYAETDPCAPADPYGISKLEAEQLLAQAGQTTGLETVVVRAPLVYGPGVRANFLRLLRTVDRGLPVPVGSRQNARSLIFRGNLVAALVLCITHPAAAGETFFVSDGEDLSTRELVCRLAVHLGRRPLLIAIPLPLLELVAAAAGRRAVIDRLSGSLVVDTSKARQVVGWQPPFSVDAGLAETVRWYRQDGGG